MTQTKTISLKDLSGQILFLNPALRERILKGEATMSLEQKDEVRKILLGLQEQELAFMQRIQESDPNFLKDFSAFLDQLYRGELEKTRVSSDLQNETSMQQLERQISQS